MTEDRRPRTPRGFSSLRRGFSLIEGLLSLAIFAAILAAVNHFVQLGIQEQLARGESTRWVSLTKAADNYVKSQDGVLRAAFHVNPKQKIVIPLTSKPGSVALDLPNPPSNGVTLKNFQDSNVLGSNFQDGDVNHATAALIVYKPDGLDTSDYEAVLVGYSPNGKPAIDDKVLVRAEGMSENRIGALLQNDPTKDVDGATGPFVRGPRGGWRIPVSDLKGTTVPINYGHLFSYVTMEKRGQNDNSRYLVRTLDTNHDNNSMTTNLDMSGNTVYNVYSLCGTTGEKVQVGGPTAENVSTDCASSTQIKVGGDLISNGGFYGAGAVESDTRVVAPYFTDGDTSLGIGKPQYYASPSQTSVFNVLKANDVQAKWFDIDALAYSSTGARPSLPTAAGGNTSASGASGVSQVRLADLFPKQVTKASYVAYDGSVIPKPDCHDGAGTGNAKLFASLTRLYNEAAPQTTVTTTITYRPVPVVTSVSASGDGNGGVNLSYTTDKVNSFESVDSTSTVDPARMYDGVSATDLGTAWRLSMPSVTSVPKTSDSTQTGVGTDFDNTKTVDGGDYQNQALVQVACYYN